MAPLAPKGLQVMTAIAKLERPLGSALLVYVVAVGAGNLGMLWDAGQTMGIHPYILLVHQGEFCRQLRPVIDAVTLEAGIWGGHRTLHSHPYIEGETVGL